MFAAALLAVSLAAGDALAGVADCMADRVALFAGGYSPPGAGLRVAELPGIVTGPPGDSLPVTGSTSTVSLGRGGVIVVAFADNVIVDGPGPDFIVFENAFFKTFVPSDPNQAYTVFAEPASVAVSDDGTTWREYPYDPAALALVGSDGTPSSALPALRGLAGITPTFTGNWTMPDDPDVWDPNGQGGVSGAGGDAFDLAVVGLASARFVRLTDLGLATGFAGTAEGFDLDSVVALHSLPAAGGPDADGDGLTDVHESFWHGSDPLDSDTDGDGEDDGVEAARCRSPLSASTAPSFPIDLDLWMAGAGAGAHATWTFLGSSARYDLARGTIASSGGLSPTVVCIENDSFNLTSADHPDTGPPAAGQAFFYVVRPAGQSAYGRASSGAPRQFGSSGCPP